MQLPIKILLTISIFFASQSVSGTKFKAAVFCDRNQKDSPKINESLTNVMDMISSRINKTRWFAHQAPVQNSIVFGLGQCYGDLSARACSDCFQRSKRRLNQCLPANSARIFLDGCFLRYNSYNFFAESVDKQFDEVECGAPATISDDSYMEQEFVKKVESVISNVSKSALKNLGYSVLGDRGGVEGVYALAQCWNTIDVEGCKKCLGAAASGITTCLPGKEGRALFTGCYLRYSTEKFYTVTAADVDEDDFEIGFIIVGLLSMASLLFLAFFGARLGYMKLSMRRREKNLINTNMHNSYLNFKYELLERATDSFDVMRKLGQGGSGSVYLGILPNGDFVAVKRLFFNTRQWVDEFFNEVNLIGGMQHKNLVKLLGCSIEGPESLLVYEYVPYRSLDQILFAKNGSQILSWKQRFNIIFGIAEGLAYLHEGCDVRIIHRDIKTSNILIDGNYNPKIADFGLARCITSGRSHISTGVAGTLGYIAPEYLVRGRLTEKVDIYAFGVMTLEIACGKKNSPFTRGSNSLLHSVWKNYKENMITESVDSALKSDFTAKEASNVLQIGLLCTQALVSLRPSMSEVIQMLKEEDTAIIPTPRQPPFLNSSVLTDESSRSITATSVDLDETISSEVSSFYSPNLTSFSKTQLNDLSKTVDLNANKDSKL